MVLNTKSFNLMSLSGSKKKNTVQVTHIYYCNLKKNYIIIITFYETICQKLTGLCWMNEC